MSQPAAPIGADRLRDLVAIERARFCAQHPQSLTLAEASRQTWLGGVPLHWMSDWATPAPIFAARGCGARLIDADGRAYDDFCLGDTPAMFGHGDARLAEAIAAQARRGTGFMLPSTDAPQVGRLLAARFGLPFWQATATATDANRAAIRWARAVTGKNRILVFDGCYHGAVEDTFVSLVSGEPGLKPGLVGQVHDVAAWATPVPFNDVEALTAELARGDVAAVLAEPVMTNCGMILPEPGFHSALRALTRQAGALLVIDETHTLSAGPGGYTRSHGLEPDILTVGKAIAGGVPAAVWGVTSDLARRMDEAQARIGPGYSGIGTTLSGNALAMAAMRVMLEEVMTDDAYARMQAGASRLVKGLRAVVARRGLAWSAVQAGARVELIFADPVPRDAAGMRKALDHDLLAAFHLWLINRRVLIAPFHNMMLVSPVTEDVQIDRLTEAVDGFAAALCGEAA